MTISFPFGFGTPQDGRPPQWWDPSGQAGNHSKELDDSRWRGATSRAFDSGTGADALFRGLHWVDPADNKAYLYLSFQVRADATASVADRIYVGFQRAAGTPAYILEIKAPAGQTGEAAVATGSRGWSTIPEGGGTRTDFPDADEPNVQDRFWRMPPDATSNAYRWAVNIRVPLTTGPDLGSNGINLGALGNPFRFWATLWLDQGATNPNPPPSHQAVVHYWPRVGAKITNQGLQTIFPATATWDNDVRAGGANAGSGVSISSGDVGTNNATGSWVINASLDHPTDNHFVARPLNTGVSPDVPKDAVEAELRIANWGSQTMNGWQTAGGAIAWEVIPFGAPAGGWGWTNGAAFGPGSKGAIEFTWTIDPTTAKLFVKDPARNPDPPRHAHQCVLTTLRDHPTNPPHPALDFIVDSTYTNMEFTQTASPARSTAEISIEGREPVGGGTAKLYVFAERTNMPTTIRPGDPRPPAFQMVEGRIVPPVPPKQHDIEDGDHGDDGPATSYSFDDIAQLGPTIRYHVYYPTTTIITDTDGRKVRLFEPQSSFGSFVGYEEQLYGWNATLVGVPGEFGASPGVVQKVGEDRFVIEVPDNGKVTIETVVDPVQQPPSADPWWLRLIKWLIAFIRRLFGKS